MVRNKYVPIIITGLAVIGFITGVVWAPLATDWLKYDRYDKNDFIDSDAYQAVFLTNDQIYFGHLKNTSPDYLILSDVYYIKVNEEGAGQIVKLGAIEPHGPKDKMIINKDQILFWENLKPDSPVIQKIKAMKLQEN